MKRMITATLSLLLSLNVWALDSDWKLCVGETIIFDKDVSIVINAYEHRTSKGRAADLTLLYGGHVLRGSYNTTESTSGSITLRNNDSKFKGNVAIDYGRGILSINGKLDLQKTTSDLKATLACETL